MSIPRPPRGMKHAGRRLWRAVMSECELDPHEVELLRVSCAVADVCEQLQTEIDRQGVVIDGQSNPLLSELRQQRLLLLRSRADLRIPEDGERRGRLQSRGSYRGA